MSILWKSSADEPSPGSLTSQNRLRLTALQDEVALLLTIPEPPHGIRVYLHNTSGYRQSPFKGIYDSLMSLAGEHQIEPQISDLSAVPLSEGNRGDWFGFRNQASEGKWNQHLLVHPSSAEQQSLTFGISRPDNTSLYQLSFLRSHFGDKVFLILEGLKDAMLEYNAQYGHWHDQLQAQ